MHTGLSWYAGDKSSSRAGFLIPRGTREATPGSSRYCSSYPYSISLRAGPMLLLVCKGNPAVCATATEMLYGAHEEERSCTFECLYITS
ncbi:hypothetical protein L1987_78155 [Smallanthus sonchifolius]|uniref:Uncharacterized protein n=1 Tax=Smallanthus sonchifolius TaxID=185202 RepID=A0ACB8ZBP6_9ASTR|nr:hypothetical protein L1987_78155 [Smallanthus sonchifolius]